MKNKLIDKFKKIRSAENLSREKLSKLIDVPPTSIKTLELRETEPSGKVLTQLCKIFPEYALWLLTDEINLNAGQISPDVKNIWKQEQKKFNSLTIKMTEEDYEVTGGDGETHLIKSSSFSTELIPFDRFNLKHLKLIKNIAKESKNLITDAIDTTDKLKK